MTTIDVLPDNPTRTLLVRFGILKYLYVGILLVCAGMLLTSCEKDDLCLHGSGDVQTYDLALSGFNKVSLTGPINLRVSQGANYEVQILAEPEFYDHLFHRVRSNRLEVGFEDNIRCFDTDEGVWVNITVPDISEIRVAGASDIRSNGDLTLEVLDIIVDGAADVMLTGTVNMLSFDVSGDINVRNYDFVATQASVKISGAGYLELSCTDTLDIDVSGAATIKYKGHPEIFQEVSGSLSLINMN